MIEKGRGHECSQQQGFAFQPYYIGNSALKCITQYHILICTHVNPLQQLQVSCCNSCHSGIAHACLMHSGLPSASHSSSVLCYCVLQLTQLLSPFLPQLSSQVSCMIQAHLSTCLPFFKNKSWNGEGHSSIIFFSGMCRFNVIKSPLVSFARLREQVINNLHFWGSTEMKLQNSAILHNLPLNSYFLIFFPSPVPPMFHPTDSANASCEKTYYKESSVLCLHSFVEDESLYKHYKISILSSHSLHCESQYGGHYPDCVSGARKNTISLLQELCVAALLHWSFLLKVINTTCCLNHFSKESSGWIIWCWCSAPVFLSWRFFYLNKYK